MSPMLSQGAGALGAGHWQSGSRVENIAVVGVFWAPFPCSYTTSSFLARGRKSIAAQRILQLLHDALLLALLATSADGTRIYS